MSYQKNRDEFVGVIVNEGWCLNHGTKGDIFEAIALARLILRNAATIQHIAIEACERPASDGEEQQSQSAAIRIREACKPWGIAPTFNGDPRGACVKLILPSGRWNSAGGKEDGYCVPTR